MITSSDLKQFKDQTIHHTKQQVWIIQSQETFQTISYIGSIYWKKNKERQIRQTLRGIYSSKQYMQRKRCK